MAKNTGGKPLSAKGEMYREFFQPLVHTMTKTHGFPSSSTREGENYRDFRTGHGDVVYGADFFGRGWKKGKVGVCVYIEKSDREWNKWLFDRLKEGEDSIESALGECLDWDRLDGLDGSNDSKACRISALRDGTIEDASKNPEEIREWMIDRLVAFRRVFGPILDGLLR